MEDVVVRVSFLVEFVGDFDGRERVIECLVWLL